MTQFDQVPPSVATFLQHRLPATNPRFRHNPVQVAYAGSISEALAQGPGHLNFIEGDTGIGKSLAYLLTVADWIARGKEVGRRGVISTFSRALQRQLMDDGNRQILADYLEWQGLPPITMAVRMGKANYINLERLQWVFDGEPLASVAVSSEREPAERQLAQWALESDGCLLDLPEADMPEGISPADIALRDGDPLPEGLKDHFESIQAADIQVINHALLAVDLVTNQRITQTGAPMVMVLDEAEHFPAVAKGLLSRRLSFGVAAQMLSRLGLQKAAAQWKALLDSHQSPSLAGEAAAVNVAGAPALVSGLKALLDARPRKARLEEDPQRRHEWECLRQDARSIMEGIESTSPSVVISYSPIRGLPSLVLHNSSGGGILKSGADQRVTLLTSATLSDMRHSPGEPATFDYLRGELVLGKADTRLGLQRSHQALDFGRVSFSLPEAPCRPLREKAIGAGYELHPAFIDHAWASLLQKKGRSLLLCVSYQDVADLMERCPEWAKGRVVTHGRGAPLNSVAEALPADGILLTPAGWEGLSPTRDGETFWQNIALLRNPTPPPDMIEHLVLTRRFMEQDTYKQASQKALNGLMFKNMVRTTHKIRQGLGRGIRHPDDVVAVLMLDPRFPRPGVQAKPNGQGMMTALAGAIPPRFIMEYEQAGKQASLPAEKGGLIV